jgi:membrane fusion protein (multidrug efflux system)
MADNFHRTMRSLERDSGIPSTLTASITLVLFCGGLFWAFHTHITRYEISDSARLEVNASAHPVQSAYAGRLVSSSLVLGRTVREGEVLAELDTENEQLALEEERARYAAIEPQLAALAAQIEVERSGNEADRRVSSFSDATALSQYRQADIEAAQVERQAARARQMRAEGILAPADADRADAEARSKRANADSLKAALSRVEPELRVKEQDREARIRQVASSKAKLESDLLVSAATIKRLESEIERRIIRAPASGRLAECATLTPGSHVSEGQQLGVILPSSQLRIVAQFQPAAALGKIRAGQPATLRLDGFPWAQFGVVTARVSAVASEISDGKVRVEMTVLKAPRVSLQHGLPGIAEIELERTTPAALLLRSAGSLAGVR